MTENSAHTSTIDTTTIVTSNERETPAVRADARNRALRTLLQGFVIDVLIAVATVSHSILTAEDFTWAILGLTVLKTILTTAASYVMRIKLGGVMLKDVSEQLPVKVTIGGYEMELQRPGHADHAAENREEG